MKNGLNLLSYGGGKAIRYVVTLYVILSMNFIIPRIMPGDPIIHLLGEDAVRVDARILENLRKAYRLDRPLHEQYIAYMLGIGRLDFGFSIHKNLKVWDLLSQRLIWTLALVLPSIVIGGVSALILGSVCGFGQGGALDRWITALATWVYTLPSFLFAMLMVSLFSYHLGWFPLGNLSSGGQQGLFWWLDVTWHLCLPVFILSIFEAAHGQIIMRSAIVQVMDEYFILVAKAKGLPARVIGIQYVLRSVLPQFISIMALNFGFMVSGALIIEIVFSLNGMGTLILDAVMARDYPVMQGAFVVITLFVLAANFMADLLYGIVDPRIADGNREGVHF